MHLIEPKDGKLKWDIRFRNHDGRTVKISGDRDEATARRIGERVMMLVRAKQNGDPPPGELQTWIDNMDSKLAARLVELGLITERRVNRNRTLEEYIDEWKDAVQGRHPKSPDHAPQQHPFPSRHLCA